MDEARRIEDYFQKTAQDFDTIYSRKKNLIFRLLDYLFRKSMFKRFEVTISECKDIKGKSVLDIGCGSGRYSVELARRGAGLVVGIDFAGNMLRLANRLAQEQGVAGICRFIKGDFLTYNFEHKFDICLAIGVLEYFKYPQAILGRIKNLAGAKIIVSLPVKWTLRSLLRKVRFALNRQEVYFYTKTRIRRMLESAQFKDYNIVRLDRDYLVIIKV